ncbi:MAG: zinc-binding dehydrogenase [Spirochaetota bacterium]|nr:zinc-binding dehydrogenase [Spirochaetota bacterium]
MKAARIISPKRYEIVDDDIPALEDDKVLVRLLRTVICGSDIPYFSVSYKKESYPFPLGYPGHECLGIVEETRNNEFKIGDRVMYYPTSLEGFKEYHLTDASRLQMLPKEGDLNKLSMTQILGSVAHSAFRIDRPYKKCVAIMGQGPVGLLFTSLMKNLGANAIIVIDPLEYRLEVAKRMGADFIINPKEGNAVDSISEITNGEMADIVIDAYGQDVEAINQCFDISCHNGQIAFFGICLEESPRLNFNIFFRKELRMIASVGPEVMVDYPYALNMILKNSIDVTPLITHELPFEEIQKGFEIATNRLDNVIKVVLTF